MFTVPKKEDDFTFVKLPAHRAGLPGKVISFYIVPLAPAYKAGLAGHIPVKRGVAHQEGFFKETFVCILNAKIPEV